MPAVPDSPATIYAGLLARVSWLPLLWRISGTMAETTRPVVRSLEWVDGMAQRAFSGGDSDGDGAIQWKVANAGLESRQ